MDPLIPKLYAIKHLFLGDWGTDILEAEPMNLSMFSHEFLAILVACTLGGWNVPCDMAVTSAPQAMPLQHLWDPKTKSAHL